MLPINRFNAVSLLLICSHSCEPEIVDITECKIVYVQCIHDNFPGN